jgi:cytoskeletal protein CcmA (bactofilin family)
MIKLVISLNLIRATQQFIVADLTPPRFQIIPGRDSRLLQLNILFSFYKENPMKRASKLFFVFSLLALLLLTFTTPANAFDGRSGENILIKSNEVIDDDLYVTAGTFVLDGTVNGDLIAVGQTLTINGKVDGDVMAAGQTIVVNGSVTGAIRMAGSILLVDEQASIGGDIIAAGYSLEIREGSGIGQDLVFAGGQLLLAGDVARNVQAAAGAFELRGTVGGNVNTEVGEADAGYAGPPPTLFMPPSSISVPRVDPGLTIAQSAKIEGNLQYTQSRELALPAGVVTGKVTRNRPATNTAAARQETTSDRILKWGANVLRSSITLILIGLFLFWLFPLFMQGSSLKLQSAIWPSLGWGVAAYAGFFFVLLLTIVGMIAGGVLFGLLTLGGLAGTVVGVGILSLFALILGFVLVTSFVAKIVFGQALGRWLLIRANSPLAERRFWPMVIGVVITVAVIALFRFPLIPGFLGGLLNFAVILFGLGALWLWGRERIARRPVAP